MKFKCDKNSFMKAVTYVSNRSFNRTTMSILEGILIDVSEKNVKLTTYDLELGIECTTDAEIETPGKILVHANTFTEIIKRLPESQIHIYLDENKMLCIECEGSKYKLATLDTDQFPEIPKIEAENSIKIEQKILKNMIKQTTFAVGTDDKKPLYTGCLFDVNNHALNIVALDGFRLAIRKMIISEDSEFKVVIPGKSLNEVAKNLQDNYEEVTIGMSKNHAVFNFDNCVITTNVLEGEFLNYEQIVGTEYITKILVNRNLLYNSLDRISLVSSSMQQKEKKQPIFMEVKIGKMEISSNSTVGIAREEIYIETEGQECSLKYNPRYFLEALRNIDDEEVYITFAGNNAPTTITSTDEDTHYKYIILPMRI